MTGGILKVFGKKCSVMLDGQPAIDPLRPITFKQKTLIKENQSGEQYYWEYMEYREQEEEGLITARFDYWNPKFLDKLEIKAKCVRITD